MSIYQNNSESIAPVHKSFVGHSYILSMLKKNKKNICFKLLCTILNFIHSRQQIYTNMARHDIKKKKKIVFPLA